MADKQHSVSQEQRARNVRLALTLLTVAVVFGLGFITKVVLLGR